MNHFYFLITTFSKCYEREKRMKKKKGEKQQRTKRQKRTEQKSKREKTEKRNLPLPPPDVFPPPHAPCTRLFVAPLPLLPYKIRK